MKPPLRIGVNWDLPRYTALNGFHMIMSSLASIKNPSMRFVRTKWMMDSNREAAIKDFLNLSNNHSGNSKISNKDNWQDLIEENFPIDISFHHTKIPESNFPFIQHFESLETLTFPLTKYGAIESSARVNGSIIAMLEKLKSSTCLRIWTHLQVSANNLIRLLGTDVAHKVDVFPLSLANIDLKAVPKKENLLTFYFGSSQAQSYESFILRGGVVSLKVALKLIDLDSRIKFIFHCLRYSKSQYRELGFSESEIIKMNSPQIIWVNRYLDVIEQRNLMGSAHFMLLPSIDIHARSIMAAMAAGSVPIILPLEGNLEMVSGCTSVKFLPVDIRDFTSYDQHLKIQRTDYAKFDQNQYKIEKELEKMIQKIIHNSLCSEKDIAEVRNFALKKWDPEIFKKNFAAFVEGATHAILPKNFANEGDLEFALDEKDFFLQPNPIRLADFGNVQVYRFRDYYISNNLKIDNDLLLLYEKISDSKNEVRRGKRLLIRIAQLAFPKLTEKYKVFLLQNDFWTIFWKAARFSGRRFLSIFTNRKR